MTARPFREVLRWRAIALDEIDAQADECRGILERTGSHVLGPPVKDAGEWDWFWHLDWAERSRLRRLGWFDPLGPGPDIVADAFELELDEAMDEWLRCTRVIDAATSMHSTPVASGRLPICRSVGDLGVKDLFVSTEFDLAKLFEPWPACGDYVATVIAEETEEQAS
jgi:hypothetical protein